MFHLKAQPVHPGIQLEVHGKRAASILPAILRIGPGGLHKALQQGKTVNFRLEVIIKERFKSPDLRVHHHHRDLHPAFAQLLAFVGIGHGEVVGIIVLQHAGHLYAATPIGKGLHHAHQFYSRTEQGLVQVQVMGQGVQVDLKDGLVIFLLKDVADAFKPEWPGAFEQNRLAAELLKVRFFNKIFCGWIKHGRHIKFRCVVLYLRPDACQPVDLLGPYQGSHLCIEIVRRHPTLQDIRQDQGLFSAMRLALQESRAIARLCRSAL